MNERTCVTCAYFYEEYGNNPPHDLAWRIKAYRCKIKVWSPVHGHFGEPTCETSRLNESMCGLAGKWWKEKDVKKDESIETQSVQPPAIEKVEDAAT